MSELQIKWRLQTPSENLRHHPGTGLVPTLMVLLLSACSSLPMELRHELNRGNAVEGEIHGVYPDLDLYVFTYRATDNFFEFVHASLVAPNETLARSLRKLRRHDRVRIEGTVLDNRSRQIHVELSALEVVENHEPKPAIPAYDYEAALPEDLHGRDRALFLVHAVHADGRVLVVEYRDVVLPVFVRRPTLTRHLARNDVIRLFYETRPYPDRPVHLELADIEQPVEVVDSVTALHGQPADVEGPLVLFPDSPQVAFNVFAVLQQLPGGHRRQYTLVNFESADAFQAIRDKLQAAWDASDPSTVKSGRNKLISSSVRVRATGTFNQLNPNQANAQIVVDGPEAIEIIRQ